MAVRRWATAVCIVLAACAKAGDNDTSGDSASADTLAQRPPVTNPVVCYVATHSVLARPEADTLDRPLRGWIRLDRTHRDSGPALLLDSDGYSLEATFRQVADSLVVAGFNDFVRIEFRLQVRDSAVRGIYHAHSDAALERDSAGVLREFRRTGDVLLAAASCDRLPLFKPR